MCPVASGASVWDAISDPTAVSTAPMPINSSLLIRSAILPIAGKGDSNWQYAWIPVLGPIAGGILGALVYKWLWMSQSGVTP